MWIGPILSGPYVQHEGVPQGSVLSCKFFSIAINNITSSLPDSVKCTLYMEDIAIYSSSRNLAALERQLQLAVMSLYMWSRDHGFTFSVDKSVVMHFCKLRGIFPEPQNTLGDVLLRVVDQTRFLGMILGKKLTWVPHIKHLKTVCLLRF